MRLGFDARLYFQTGVGVYIRNLLYHLPKFLPKDWQVFVYFLEEDKDKINLSNFYIPRFIKGHWHSFEEQTFFLKELIKDRLDLIHFTYFSYPLLYPKDFVITIHDLTPLKFKTGRASSKGKVVYELKHFFYRAVLQGAFKRARRIIVPSFSVASDIELAGVVKKKVKVIYEGVDEDIVSAKEKKVKLLKPFFLYVGNFYPHKNVEFAIEGFLRFGQRKKFVLVGPDDFFARKLKKKYKEYTDKRIIFLHDLDRKELKFLYKNAVGLIHPSFSEGFGLTLLEALYFNCPVAASNLPVFHELYGDLIIYFNPKDKFSLKQAFEKLNNYVLPKKEKIKILKKFDFLKTAKETVQVYKASLSS